MFGNKEKANGKAPQEVKPKKAASPGVKKVEGEKRGLYQDAFKAVQKVLASDLATVMLSKDTPMNGDGKPANYITDSGVAHTMFTHFARTALQGKPGIKGDVDVANDKGWRLIRRLTLKNAKKMALFPAKNMYDLSANPAMNNQKYKQHVQRVHDELEASLR